MIKVNGTCIPEANITAELPHHAHEADPLRSASQELVLRELVAQQARSLGLSGTDDQVLMDAVFAREIQIPEPQESECRRYYDQHRQQFMHGQSIEVWHILFQLTPAIDAKRLRQRAGEILQEIHNAPDDSFADYARRYSNCPSASRGGFLGALARHEAVAEFDTAIFAMPAHTLRNRLVDTRFGFHIVRSGARQEGLIMPFDSVRLQIAQWLTQASRRRATAQYLQWLVGQATIEGLDMQGADSPLVQ